MVQRRVVMALLDDLWLRHVQRVELMRRAAPLRAHARRDPLIEFKIESLSPVRADAAPASPQRDRRDHARRLRREALAAGRDPDDEHELVLPDHLVSALH